MTVAAVKARVTGGVETTYWTGEDKMVIMAPVIVDQTESEETSGYVWRKGLKRSLGLQVGRAKFLTRFLVSPTISAH